eukprot:557169_1
MDTSYDKLSVVIGTYHCSVAQFNFDLEIGTCKRKWVDDTATRSISAITFNGFFSIFGGNDELVRIVNVASNQNVGALHEHQGSITHLETFQNTHLFSSSDDGKIYIWEIGGGHKNRVKHKKNMGKSWECLCCMHNLHQPSSNSQILSFSVHPSGRLLLSIDSKHELKIWDLIRAKCIVTIKMPARALEVLWSPDGHTYAVIRESKALIYSKQGVLHKVIKPITKLVDNEYYDRYQSTIVSFTYVTHDMVAIADMSARIVVYDIDTKTPLFRLSGHEQEEDDEEAEHTLNSRPKIRNLKASSLNDNLYLIAADNRGRICIWNVHECLNRVIAINSEHLEEQNEDDEDLTMQQKDDDSEEEEEEEDYMVDENGLFTFPALMQVDTETHITCMDVGLVGRLNQMYKWKKPKIVYGTYGAKENVEQKTENELCDVSGKKRTLEAMVNEEVQTNAVDSDDEARKKTEKKKRKKKKKRK